MDDYQRKLLEAKGKKLKAKGIMNEAVAGSVSEVYQRPIRGVSVTDKDLKPDPMRFGVEGSVIGERRRDWDPSRMR